MAAAASAIVAFPVAARTARIPDAPVPSVASDTPMPARLLSFAEQGLPADWLPMWRQMPYEGVGELLARIAEEVWQRTDEPRFAATVAEAERAARLHPSVETAFALNDATFAQLMEQQQQAARVGWALCQAMHFTLPAGPIYEALTQAAMALARLAPMPRAERERWDARTTAAYDAMKLAPVATGVADPGSTYADDPGYQAFLQDMAKVGPDAMAPAVVLGAIHRGIPREELGAIGKADAYAATREDIGPWIAKFQAMSDAEYAEWVGLAHKMFDA